MIGVRKGLGLLSLMFTLLAASATAQVVLTPAQPNKAQPGAGQPSPAQPGATHTEPRPDPNDPDSVLVEELVVVARDKGPAWWTVSNGVSTVYVLGAPSLAPKQPAVEAEGLTHACSSLARRASWESKRALMVVSCARMRSILAE